MRQDHSPLPAALESRVALITKAYSKGLIAEFYNELLGISYGQKFLLFLCFLDSVSFLVQCLKNLTRITITVK